MADGLHHMISICKKEDLLKGLGCWDDANAVINLQYADDTLIFGQESIPQSVVLKWVLHCFEKWSGLKINYHKSSSLIFLVDISVNSFLISLMFNSLVQKLPITYLDLPLCTGKLNKL